MRFQGIILACLIVLVCLAAMLVPGEARKSRKGGRRVARTQCRYKGRGVDGACDLTTNTKPVTMALKKAKSPADCSMTKVVSMPCDDFSISKKQKMRCKYDKNSAVFGDCDENGMRAVTWQLKNNQDAGCEQTKSKLKKCKGKKKNKNGRRGGKRNKGCVYKKQPWSECNGDTNTRQREIVLTSGDPAQCLPKKIVTKQCKKACRFTKGQWSPCDPTTNLKHRSLTPKAGSSQDCQSTMISKSCHRRAQLTEAKSNKCKYSLSEWSPCDPRSNTMTQMMTLKHGDPNVCMKWKKLTKKCKTVCKFARGKWTPCNDNTQLTTRVDTLIKGRPSECDSTREITKKCKRECKYTLGDWGECDPVTQHRIRVKKLIEGDAESCDKEMTVSRPCTKRDGKERCFFGVWGEFGPCTNGVMTKNRPVLQGGVECERKAVITKACGASES